MKLYAEKATQTDFLAIPATPSIVLGSSELANDSALETIITLQNSAYTYSETDAFAGKSPLKSCIPPRRRYAQLPFNRPVEFKSPTKRVVSLPEEYANKQRSEDQSQRVVSMPEILKPLSPSASDSFSSLDTSAISVESTKPSRLHTYPHSDLPSTPSPPSSPESIMIIGNNSQVPRTLLRPGCAYNQTYGGTGGKFCLFPFSGRPLSVIRGWISWANSPPRPIPALHGPLSLPYARCPS